MAQAKLLSTSFRPAAAYLLEGPPRLPRDVDLVPVHDADVGPILTHPHDTEVGRSIRETKTWEPYEGRFLRSILQPGMHAIDIGANIGYFTLMMAQAVGPVGRVLAVEADAETFQILRANVALQHLENVELLPIAAHRVSCLVTITRNPLNHGANTAVRATTGWDSSPAQGMALDDVLELDVPVDVIKVDVEGMDHIAIQGLERTISRWRPTILVEFNPDWLDVLGIPPNDVLQYYRELGYIVRLLGGDALRLQQVSAMALDQLLIDNLVVTPAAGASLAEGTRKIHFVNLILTPAEDLTAWERH